MLATRRWVPFPRFVCELLVSRVTDRHQILFVISIFFSYLTALQAAPSGHVQIHIVPEELVAHTEGSALYLCGRRWGLSGEEVCRNNAFMSATMCWFQFMFSFCLSFHSYVSPRVAACSSTCPCLSHY